MTLCEKSRKKIYGYRKQINEAEGGDRVGVETNFRDMREPLGVTGNTLKLGCGDGGATL